MSNQSNPPLTDEFGLIQNNQLHQLLSTKNELIDELVEALRNCAAVEPVRGKASRNAAALVRVQTIARAALAAVDKE
jgi:hypothetical protein